ncbi:MAG TPA: N-acetyl-gamma-glutamyl-phosphate reductase [Bacteroidota bacterium]|nr:N-acetyl-gamma-glutamyl-phosphate reductase [Bacteroidota bacterium]
MNKIHVSLIGASGYSGVELIKYLLRHPQVEIDNLFANTSAGKHLSDVAPVYGKNFDPVLESFSVDKIEKSDLVFIALPSGEALNLVPQILAAGKKVIDLGGDFRLQNTALYEKYYKRTHTALNELSKAVYGFPEWHASRLKNAQFISNPGCYPTSAILPLAPLLKDGVIEQTGIAISSLSGVSGAGKSSSLDFSFTEINESVRAYKVGVHQHIPEIRMALEQISGKPATISFVPHLIPITRGIYTSSYAMLAKGKTEADILAAYEKYYGSAPFVRFSATKIPDIKHVAHTNFIDIGFKLFPENGQVVILSVIDNLVKGAAGQAVQNMNVMFGFIETEGLL